MQAWATMNCTLEQLWEIHKYFSPSSSPKDKESGTKMTENNVYKLVAAGPWPMFAQPKEI